MTTTNDNILNTMYNNHRILIDRIDEYGMDGELATSKRMITVIRYGDDNLTPMIFNVSPYTPLVDMHTMARVWIDCGCPSDGDANGIPRKWTKESLHQWVAS